MRKSVFLYLNAVFLFHFICGLALQESSFSNDKNYLENERYQEFVVPKIYHTKRKTQLLSTRENDGIHFDEIVVVLNLNGTKKIVDLRLNKHLIPDGFLYSHQENGKRKVVVPKFADIDFCHYVGEIRGVPQSWVALSTCDGLSGILFENDRYYEIENHNSSGYHVFSESTVMYRNITNDMVKPQNGITIDYQHSNKRRKRSLEIGQDLYSNQSNYLELIIVMDYGVYVHLGYSKDNCTKHASGIANIMNKFYNKVNISVVLVAVEIWSEYDKITQSSNKTLANFYDYCKKELAKIRAYDSAQLISYSETQIGAIGVGYVNAICTDQSVGINNYQRKQGLALTIAHEVGHNLGLQHDDGNASYVCSCPGSECLMLSVRSTIPTDFSDCSVKTLTEYNRNGNYYCLKNVPKSLPNFDLRYSTCGNNVVEEGEDCDCGDIATCDNLCCNATTCRFTENSKCAAGECCDLQTCQMKTRATTCRSAKTECDLAEYCDGTTPYCPSDTYKLETEQCANGKSYCFHGVCLATDAQKVRRYLGVGFHKQEECYAVDVSKVNYNMDCNIMFSTSGFYDGQSKRFEAATCRDDNYVKIKFSGKTYISKTTTFSKNHTFVACHLVLVSNDDFEPNMTLCNSSKVTCTTFSAIRNLIPTCPQSCNERGWCNNKGECHCDNVFEPPDCSALGYGGSFSSGYARNPYPLIVGRNVILTFFLGIIPSIIIILFCIRWHIRPRINKKKRSLRVQGYMQRFVRGVSQRFASRKNTNKKPEPTKPVQNISTNNTSSTREASNNSIDDICKPVGFTITPLAPQDIKPPTNNTNNYANVNMVMYNKCQEEIYTIPTTDISNRTWCSQDDNPSAPLYDIVKPNRPVTQYLNINTEQEPVIYENFQNFDTQISEKPTVQPKPILPKAKPNVKPKPNMKRENLETMSSKNVAKQKPLVMKKPNLIKQLGNKQMNSTANGVDENDKSEDLENLSVKDIIQQMNEKKLFSSGNLPNV